MTRTARDEASGLDASGSSARPELCILGSLNLDHVISAARLPGPGETVLGGDYHEYPGGKGLNQAVAAARAGARTALCGCVGSDQAGVVLRGVARDAGIAIDMLAVVDSAPTGRALIATSSAEAQNMIVVAPGANSALSPDWAMRGVDGAHVVLAQLEVPARAVIAGFRAARERGAVTILNPAPAAATTEELLSLCDFVIPNESEAEALGGRSALLAAGARNVIVTLGSRGVCLSAAGQQDEQLPTFTVDAVDTTAAGDAFCGAFAAGLAQGLTAHEAIRLGTAAGALAATRFGAVPSLPVRAEIDALIAATGSPAARSL